MSIDLQSRGVDRPGFIPHNSARGYRARPSGRWRIAAFGAPVWLTLLLFASRLDSWYPPFVVGACSIAFYLIEIFAERGHASSALSAELERVRADIKRRLRYYDNTSFSSRYLEARLDEEVKRSRRYRLPLTFLLLTTGSDPSDRTWDDAATEVLTTTSKVLRSEDILGYLGDSLFGIILPHTAITQGGVVVGRLTAGLTSCDPVFGIAEIDDNVSTGGDLMARARTQLDTALLGQLKSKLWNETTKLE